MPPISPKISRAWPTSTLDCAAAAATRRRARATALIRFAMLPHLPEYVALYPENAGGGHGQRPGRQAAEGAHADHCHGVESHDAPTEFIRNQGLDQSIGRGHLAHHTISDQRHNRQREIENVRTREEAETGAQQKRAPEDHL